MSQAIYVRYEGRYWRLSTLFKRYGIETSTGYRRHVKYGRPEVYKPWMLVKAGQVVAVPVSVTIEGVKYASIKEACRTLGVTTLMMRRRIKKYGTTMTIDQLLTPDPRGGVRNFGDKANKKPASEWEQLSSTSNTGAARV